MQTIRNLTPHEIAVYDRSGEHVIIRFPPGRPARVTEVRKAAESIADLPVSEVRYGGVSGLPAPEVGVWLIVSQIVLSCERSRRVDLISPDTADGAVRDTSGRIVGTTGFVRFPPQSDPR